MSDEMFGKGFQCTPQAAQTTVESWQNTHKLKDADSRVGSIQSVQSVGYSALQVGCPCAN